MKALRLAVLLAGAAGTPSFAAFGSEVGSSAAQFLQIGAGARALGMGEALSACAEGPEAVYWNPAGLAAAKTLELTYARAELPLSVHHDYAAAALPLAWAGGVFGFSLTRLSQAGIEKVDNAGVGQGSFFPHSESVSLAYARTFGEDGGVMRREYFSESWNAISLDEPPLRRRERPRRGRLSVGAAVKAISETLGTRSASGLALDAGVAYRPRSHPALTLGAVVRNAGSRLTFIQKSEPLPAQAALGVSKEWPSSSGRLMGAVEAAVALHGRPYGKLGAEWERGVSVGLVALVRAGYQGRSAPDLGALSGLTVGAGVRRGGLSCDLAFQPMGLLGEAFRLGLGWKFGRKGS